MSVRTSKPALNLRDLLTRITGIERRIGQAAPSPIAHTGDGSTTTFACTRGHKPVVVWEDGVMQRAGGGAAYTVAFDGFAYSVVFATAPASAARVDILQYRA